MIYNGESLTIQLPYLTIAAKQWGNPDGLPILALHGWLDNAASFDGLAPLLSQYYWVVIDLPGHGLSDHKAKGDSYPFVNYAADILFTADALGWESFSIVGHSMGAGIATLVAGTIPERIKHLILIDTVGPLTETPEETPQGLYNFYLQLKKILAKSSKAYPDISSACKARKKFGVSAMSDESIECIVKRGTKITDEGVFWRHDPQLLVPSPARLTEAQVASFLRNIRCPVCFIQPESGIKFPEELVAKRCGLVDNLYRFSTVGGHHVHLDTPEPVANVLQLFFAQIET